MKLPEQSCTSCPFGKDGIKLDSDKLNEIYTYLLQGTNHLCHSDRTNKTVCFGGREFQLEVWHKIGYIAEPTNECLAETMKNRGVEPKEHIDF